MLRARRLPLLQSPLPGWRATTPATAALTATRAATAIARARRISCATTLQSNGSEGDHTSPARAATQEIKSETREQTKQESVGERTGKRELVFRKISPGDRRTRTAMRARSMRRNLSEQHLYTNVAGFMPFQNRGTSGTEDNSDPAEGPKFPWLADAPAKAVHGGRLPAAAGQPKVDLTAEKLKSSDLKRAIPAGLDFNARAKIAADTQASVPAQAATRTPSMAANLVPEPGRNSEPAKVRVARLEASGSPPPFPRRNYGWNGDTVAAAVPAGTATKPTLEYFGDPILRRGFLVGNGMNPFLQSSATQNPEERRFRVVPTWQPYIRSKAADQGSESKASGHLSSEETSGSSMHSDSSGEVGKPDGPVETELSIFDRLFNEKGDKSSLRLVAPDSLGPEDEGDANSSSWVDLDTPMKPRQIDDSIYWRLFPEEAQGKTEEPEQTPGVLAQEQLAPFEPSDASLFVSLRNEVRNWIPAADRKEVNAPELGEYGSHSTVVVISAVSSSLIDSDFYRIIPEGKYVEGWAGGLVKVAQARDPISYEPVGQYFLMFHSRPSAVAYAAEVKRLHALSQRLMHAPGSSGRKTARGKLESAPARPQPCLTQEEEAAARSFALCSPDAELRVSVRMWGLRMVGQIASKTDITDVVQALRPEAETPAKVLLVVGGHHGGLTARELWLALRDDGRERGTPWVLKSAREGLMPVRMRSLTNQVNGRVLLRAEAMPVPVNVDAAEREGMLAEPGGRGEGGERHDKRHPYQGDEDPQQAQGGEADGYERFNRFVLTFTQPVDARRFIRGWHKRAIWDTEQGRSVVIDAVALS